MLIPSTERGRWLRNAPLARYMGISAMTLWRWKKDEELKFPAATVINNIEYNDVPAVDQWMRERAVKNLGGQAMTRKQARTRRVTIHNIVASKEFARGFDEARNGFPFNADIDSWSYERGRCFGFIAPLNMSLRIGTRLNPLALKLAEAAFSRKLLI